MNRSSIARTLGSAAVFSFLVGSSFVSSAAWAEPSTRSAEQSAKLFQSEPIDFSALPEWKGGIVELHDAFLRMRDEPLYTDPEHPEGLRRAPWLLAQDGCYVRAAHVANQMGRLGYPRPGKIFLFGPWASMKLRTPFHPEGVAWWKFHVASAYRIGANRVVLFDASIEPHRFIEFDEWAKRIMHAPRKVSVAVCDSYAYATNSRCIGGGPEEEETWRSDLENFLTLEWRTLIRAGHDPRRVLYNEPPWREEL